MATGDKVKVLVTLEGEMSDLKDLIELAKERGFKTPLAAMTRDLKQAEAEFAEILSLASVDGEMRERLEADSWRLRSAMAMTADTDEWSVTLIRAPIVHIPIYPVSHCRTALPARLGEFSWLVVAIVRGVRTESSSRLAGRARCRSVLSGCRNFNGGPLSSSALFRHSVMQCPVFSTGGSPSRRTPSEPETVGMSSARLARVDAVMQHRYVDSGYLPGTPTYVYRKRHLVHTGMCGHMYIERDKPMREDPIFRTYSMTKAITAVALMMLVEEGLIGLGDDVDSHIPAWKNLGVYASRISSLLPDTPPSFLTAPVLRP